MKNNEENKIGEKFKTHSGKILKIINIKKGVVLLQDIETKKTYNQTVTIFNEFINLLIKIK